MFHLAASKGHANLAKFFHGKFFHKPKLLVNASHDTPLHVSVKSNHYDFTKALLEVLKENTQSLHYEIAKPTNLNCQSPREGLWNIPVKQIDLFEDTKKNTYEIEDEFECDENILDYCLFS